MHCLDLVLFPRSGCGRKELTYRYLEDGAYSSDKAKAGGGRGRSHARIGPERRNEKGHDPALRALLNLDPVTERLRYNDDAVRKALRRRPGGAAVRYRFRAFGGDAVHPLHAAVALGASVDVVARLWDAAAAAGMDVDGGLGSGWTALHLACHHGASPGVVRFLVHKCPGALGRRDDMGGLPLHYACSRNASVEVVRALAEAYPKALGVRDGRVMTPLHHACAFRAPVDVVRLLVRMHPAALRERDALGWLPLHHACHRGAPFEVGRVLLENDVRTVDAKGGDGMTPQVLVENRAGGVLLDVLASIRIAQALIRLNPQRNGYKMDALRMMEELINMKWWRGSLLLFDVCPTVMHSLRLRDEVLPHLLSKVGRECKLATVFSTVRDIAGIFLP